MITIFDRYPLPQGTHPEHPMWSRTSPVEPWTRRVDGATVTRVRGLHPGWAIDLGVEEKLLKPSDVNGEVDDGTALGWVDEHHPSAPPPPRARQVWAAQVDDTVVANEIVFAWSDGEKEVVAFVGLSPDEPGEVGLVVLNLWPQEGWVMVADFDGPKVWTPLVCVPAKKEE